jgi:hypothetical protein
LNWNQGGITAAWYILVAVIVVVFFFIQVLFHFIRNKIATKLGKRVVQTQDVSMEKVETNQSSIV